MRRLLVYDDIDIASRPHFDVVIIGSGIAGLYAALNLDSDINCAIVTKGPDDRSSSWYAQGGIAAAVAEDDKPEWHMQDTLIAGAGACDVKAVEVLVEEGPENIRNLVEMQVPFDVNEDGELLITREGGHKRRRIVHCGGDATGRETVKRLEQIAYDRSNITFLHNSFFYDITTDDSGVTGVVVRGTDGFRLIAADNVIVATGGIGQIYSCTTNPLGATGDGMAAAQRAGAKLINMEFVQFHPTALMARHEDDRFFLISEAVRGEGGLLRNENGERFMDGVHEMAELAPRDIVTRGIIKEMNRTGAKNVYLDITMMNESFFSNRFPTIFAECRHRGINVPYQFIPVRPVQHYQMGGIGTDIDGRTGVDGLFACGECSWTGIHGANRLASNSTLECLVFGRRCARYINASRRHAASAPELLPAPALNNDYCDWRGIRRSIQQTMMDKCGIIRREAEMREALDEISGYLKTLDTMSLTDTLSAEVYSMAQVACQVLEGAIARKTSVGAHYRVD